MNSSPFRIIARENCTPHVGFVYGDTSGRIKGNTARVTLFDIYGCAIEIFITPQQADTLQAKLVECRDMMGSRWYR